jgi:hypothetical protein
MIVIEDFFLYFALNKKTINHYFVEKVWSCTPGISAKNE